MKIGRCIHFFWTSLLAYCAPDVVASSDNPSTSFMESCGQADDLQVPTLVNFNDSKSFLEKYVMSGLPVVIPSNEFINDLDFDKIIDLPEAFTTYVEVKSGDRKRQQMSMRQVLQSNDDITVSVPIPSILKTLIPLPAVLQCEPITKNLLQTRLEYTSKEKSGKPLSNDDHSVVCQIFEKTTLIMAKDKTEKPDADSDKKESPTAQPEDVEDSLHQNPDGKCYRIVLNSGDCLFLPARWMYRKQSTERSLMAKISWKENLPASEFCGNLTDTSLLSLIFEKDPPMDLMSFFGFVKLHHFIERYFLKPKDLTLSDFQSLLKQDEKVNTKKTWSKEDKAIIEQMFSDLDTNKDKKLSVKDFDDIKLQDLKNLAKKVGDSSTKLGAGKELGGLESIMELTKSLTSDMEGNIESVRDSFAKLFHEINEVEKEIDEREQQNKDKPHSTPEASKKAEDSLKSLNDMLDILRDEL